MLTIVTTLSLTPTPTPTLTLTLTMIIVMMAIMDMDMDTATVIMDMVNMKLEYPRCHNMSTCTSTMATGIHTHMTNRDTPLTIRTITTPPTIMTITHILTKKLSL